MSDLTNRLRCRYPIGPIQANGEPEFGWRDMSGPMPEGVKLPMPIMKEAADQIEAMEKALREIADILQEHPQVNVGNSKVHFAYHKAVSATKERTWQR